MTAVFGRSPAAFKSALMFLLLSQVILGTDAYSDDLIVEPKYLMVNPGDEAKVMCKMSVKLETCIFKMANGKNGLLIKPDIHKEGIFYHGNGLENGECGVAFNPVKEEYNGNMTCNLYPSSDPTERQGTIQFIVARKPSRPILEVSVGGESSGRQAANTYRERDQLTAICTVRDGRPAANISWFLDQEQLFDGLRMPLETCHQGEICTIQQNLTRTLQSSDDKKRLKCVASHFALKGETLLTEYQINVNYPPKPAEHAFEFFGLVEGAVGRVPVTIEANPKPSVVWTIGGETILENSHEGRYTVEATVSKTPGMYESVLLIDTLTKEDTDREYRVTASNSLGENQYTVSISTSPEPKVLEMGAGLIIVIVAAILFILVILGAVFYARAKGKLCFAGRSSHRVTGESSDTESADHTTNRPKLTFKAVFKKKSDKVAADKEVLKNIAVDDEKSENVEAQAQAQPVLNSEGENVVYAELDLGGGVAGPAVVLRGGDDDKTEYAEIIHTQPPAK